MRRATDLRRVVYVIIPFTSIIEQTAQVFAGARDADAVLEHHASFDWEALERKSADLREADAEGPSGADKLRKAAENWDVPIVVTTVGPVLRKPLRARTSRCRKLHNLAKSVIVLDEAQMLPPRLLRPCLSALDELAANYGASVVLCTATQPAVTRDDGFKNGLAIGPERELAPDPDALYAALDRVTIQRRPEPVEDAEIAARFAQADRMLCIVNARRHAVELFDSIRTLEWRGASVDADGPRAIAGRSSPTCANASCSGGRCGSSPPH